MQNRIIEITTDGVHVSLYRGFVKLSKKGEEVGRVGLPDVGAIIIRGYGASVSTNLVARLASEKIPVLLCGPNQSPSAMVWPIDTHHAQGHIIEAQASLTQPQKKRLWQSLIKAKINAQANALMACGEEARDLLEIAGRVRSGDPDNQEAFAARRYWPRIMGAVDKEFSRKTEGGGLNRWLNYGYTILRAGAARSLLASGLHPSLSVHHISRGEALRLSSDIMEPFRPWVDLTVRKLAKAHDNDVELDRDKKASLVQTLSLDLKGPYGASPLQTCMDRLCQSFASVCLGERRSLEITSELVEPTKEKVR